MTEAIAEKKKTNKKAPEQQSGDQRVSNQALQTTSVTRSGFGKVPVSDRQRRGV
jgi:hypothetical protein